MVKANLTFINASYDSNRPSVVIMQKNDIVSDASGAVAWKVIKHCGYLCYHPFTFSLQTHMMLYNGSGNSSAAIQVEPGNLYRIYQGRSGRIRTQTIPANDCMTIPVHNMCDQETICCHLYRDHRLVAVQEPVPPQQYALFRLRPSIFVAALPRIDEGCVLPPATVAAFKTEFDLLGIASAELILTGGGPGPYAMPLRMHLENIKDWPVSTAVHAPSRR